MKQPRLPSGPHDHYSVSGFCSLMKSVENCGEGPKPRSCTNPHNRLFPSAPPNYFQAKSIATRGWALRYPAPSTSPKKAVLIPAAREDGTGAECVFTRTLLGTSAEHASQQGNDDEQLVMIKEAKDFFPKEEQGKACVVAYSAVSPQSALMCTRRACSSLFLHAIITAVVMHRALCQNT